jgi:hypothetical protein
MFSIMPEINITIMREVPPKLMKGSVIPLEGSKFTDTQILMMACSAIQRVRPMARVLL